MIDNYFVEFSDAEKLYTGDESRSPMKSIKTRKGLRCSFGQIIFEMNNPPDSIIHLSLPLKTEPFDILITKQMWGLRNARKRFSDEVILNLLRQISWRVVQLPSYSPIVLSEPDSSLRSRSASGGESSGRRVVGSKFSWARNSFRALSLNRAEVCRASSGVAS